MMLLLWVYHNLSTVLYALGTLAMPVVAFLLGHLHGKQAPVPMPTKKDGELKDDQAKVDCTGNGSVATYESLRGQFLNQSVDVPASNPSGGQGDSGSKEGNSNSGS
jgi:hypothetical protein